jgi:hypothetical protein
MRSPDRVVLALDMAVTYPMVEFQWLQTSHWGIG